MDDISAVYDVRIVWGCVSNLMSKIGDIESIIEGGWQELIDMTIDAVSMEEENKSDSATVFFDLFQFFFRLYYRLRANPVKRPFNIVKNVDSNGEDAFMIQNYDYIVFKWLKGNGFGAAITNDYVIIPKSKLNDKQRRSFERRCK